MDMGQQVDIGSAFGVQVIRATPTLNDWIITIAFFAFLIIITYYVGTHVYRRIKKIKPKEENKW